MTTSRQRPIVATARPATIDVPGLPTLPGLIVRRYRGPADHPGMAAANNAWRASVGISEHVTSEVLDNLYAHLTNSDPFRDCLVLDVEGEIAGYVRTEWLDDPGSGDRISEASIVLAPSLASHATYGALLAYGERRLMADSADRISRPGDSFRAWIHDTDGIQASAYHEAGYAAVHRWYEMVRPTLDDLPDAPMPDGLQLRPVRPEHWRPIWDADVEAFSDDWDPPDMSETAFQRFLGEPHQQPELWQVAWDGDQVAGHVLVTINAEEDERFGRRRGVLDSVAVRRPWRRRGLARALIVRAVGALRDHGQTSAALGVDVDNPNQALDLYTSCGFVVDISGTVYEKSIGSPTSGS
ncbi:MAG TPA: GNAT family N-acetyltransferase [Candidatus Limnocylindrales bacterium]